MYPVCLPFVNLKTTIVFVWPEPFSNAHTTLSVHSSMINLYTCLWVNMYKAHTWGVYLNRVFAIQQDFGTVHHSFSILA